MRKFSQKFKTGASVVAVVVVLLGIYSYRKLAALGADPTGEKDCGPAMGRGEQAKLDLERVKAIAPLRDVKWSQLGGSINDASCLNRTEIYGVVEVRSVEDIAKTLALRATTSSPSPRPAYVTAWAVTPSATAASCSTCADSTRSCSMRVRGR